MEKKYPFNQLCKKNISELHYTCDIGQAQEEAVYEEETYMYLVIHTSHGLTFGYLFNVLTVNVDSRRANFQCTPTYTIVAIYTMYII